MTAAVSEARPDINERYTTPETMAWALEKCRIPKFDLDVAACEESHWAGTWYDKEADGLRLPWRGNVWANPPWDVLQPWLQKAWYSWYVDRPSLIAMLLPGNRTEQPFWAEFVEPYRDGRRRFIDEPGARTVVFETHFPLGRPRYGSPGDPTGELAGSPNFTSVMLVWRSQP